MPRPFTRLPEPWAMIRHCTPNWFAVPMGTGIVALVLLRGSDFGLYAVAEALWLVSLGLVGVFGVLFTGRLVFFRETLQPLLQHPIQSMFLGTIPLSLATVLNGWLVFGAAHWGAVVFPIAQVVWWITALLAVFCAVLVPYLMFTRQSHSLDRLTAVWLLPIVAPEVAANAGAMLVPHLSPQAAQGILVTGFWLWGLSLSLAFSLITLVLLRLALHKLPEVDFAATSWLPVGPLATGCLGLVNMGREAPAAFAGTSLQSAAELVRDLGLFGGLALWGAALWWFVLALLFARHHLRDRMQFNLGWWGFIFPLGVFTLASWELFQLTHQLFFVGMTLALGGLLVGIWLVVASKTLQGIWHGELFRAPCLLESSPRL